MRTKPYSMTSKLYKFISFTLVAVVLTSCVAERRFQDEVRARSKAEEESAKLKSENIDLNARTADLITELQDANKQLEALRKDTASLSNTLNRITINHDRLNETYEQ